MLNYRLALAAFITLAIGPVTLRAAGERPKALPQVPWIKLDTPFVFRGDSRPPDLIYQYGFQSRTVMPPEIGIDGTSRGLVTSTFDLLVAAGFATNPDFDLDKAKEDFGWIYLVHADYGFDVRQMGRRPMLAQEIGFMSVKPENVMAAIRVRSTVDTISAFVRFQDIPIYERRIYVDGLTFNPRYKGSKDSHLLEEMKAAIERKHIQNNHPSEMPALERPMMLAEANLNQIKITLQMEHDVPLDETSSLTRSELNDKLMLFYPNVPVKFHEWLNNPCNQIAPGPLPSTF